MYELYWLRDTAVRAHRGEAGLQIETFTEVALRAAREFPTTKQFGTMEYIASMKALAEAGFTYQPNWQLVDAVRPLQGEYTNPLSVPLIVSHAFIGYFGANLFDAQLAASVGRAAVAA